MYPIVAKESLRAPVVLLALATAVYWPGILSAAVAPRWAVLYVGVPLVLLLAPEVARFWTGIASWLWVSWISVAVLSLLWSPEPISGINSVVHLLVLFGAFTIGAAFGARGAIYGCAAGLIPSLVIVPWDAGGLFWNKNVLAELCCLIAVWFLVEKRYWLSAPYLFGVLWTNSRAALIVLALVGLNRLPKYWRAASFLLVFLLVGLFSFLQLWGLSSLTVRLQMWVSTVAFSTPFGHGIGSFAYDYPLWEHPHNELLYSAYELGIFSILPLALFVYTWSMEPRVHIYPDYYHESLLAPLAVLSAFGLLCLVSFPLSDPITGAIGSVMAGYLSRTRHRIRLTQLVRRVVYIFGFRQRTPA